MGVTVSDLQHQHHQSITITYHLSFISLECSITKTETVSVPIGSVTGTTVTHGDDDRDRYNQHAAGAAISREMLTGKFDSTTMKYNHNII